MAKPSQGYLLIADISGYTSYLSKSELEHAQDILTALLELVVDHTRPPLIISGLAGDAVMSYGFQDHFFQGQTFVELIEETYIAFRRLIEQMVLNNSCGCIACANVSTLDLKFFVHYGEFGVQQIGGRPELVGSDVNLIHRLLKNRVVEATGLRAYTLYTDSAIKHLGLEEAFEILTPHSETYEHLGEVKVWLQDMHRTWAEKREAARIHIPEEHINVQVQVDIKMSPEMVWDYLMQPEFRDVIMGADRHRILKRSGGRIATGSVFHCVHGDTVIPQTILEWQPFERIVTQNKMPPKDTYILAEFLLEPSDVGTRLTMSFSKATGPLAGRVMIDVGLRKDAKIWQKAIEAFQQRIESDHAVKRSDLQPFSATPEINPQAVVAQPPPSGSLP